MLANFGVSVGFHHGEICLLKPKLDLLGVESEKAGAKEDLTTGAGKVFSFNQRKH